MSFKYCLFLYLFAACECVLYRINETEYKRIPPLFAMDDYNDCLLDSNGIYCVADFKLLSENQSQLMHIIQEYSMYTMKHFNHTQIHRAVCLSTTCQDFYLYKTNKTVTLDTSLERCINRSIWDKYGLEAKLLRIQYCNENDRSIPIDGYDIGVAIVYVLIVVLNITGSLYDIVLCRKNTKKGNSYLLAFSMRLNWKKLIASATLVPDPRLKRLSIFHGLRAMTIICVIFSHTGLLMTYTYISNPLYIEKTYDDPLKQLVFNGSLVIHTFFLMSSFLLAFNLQVHSEKHTLTWTQIPRGIFLRWLRLTPPYALVIATTSTWLRRVGDGPLWRLVVTSESDKCRQYWWANLFYFNNYIYKQDTCFPQGWYLAADTQLFCVGLILLVLVREPQARRIALSATFLLSLVITAAHTYFEDLDAVVIQSPESYRTLYVDNNTFRLVYIRGHTNLSTYTMGLAGGLLTYHWQNINIDLSKYKKYRWMFWLEFPLAVALILTGGFFYIDGRPQPTLVKVLYATFYKPAFLALVMSFTILCIFKFESVYRGIVEWRGFTWAGRVSYSAFLVHAMFQRGYIGAQVTPMYLSDYNVAVLLFASLFLSFLGGALLWLTVEAPLVCLSRAVFTPDSKNK